MTTLGHYVFSRHETFSGDDLSLVIKAVKETEDRVLENKLFSLFDGYLHHDLLSIAEGKVSEEVYCELTNLVLKIKNHGLAPAPNLKAVS